MSILRVFTMAFLCLGMSSIVLADDAAEIDKVRKMMSEAMRGAAPDVIAPAPVKGLYEVIYGTTLFYVTADARYLIQGNIMDMQTRQNMTEPRLDGIRLKTLNTVAEDQMVVFKPKEVKHTVTVFTDIDCGYCRKLHNEMDEILKRGIKVRYMMFPRSGPNTPSYFKAESVWCAADRNTAMTDAKAGKDPEKKTCDNPIMKHLEVGELVGVNGTPAIVLENGRMVPGYVPAARLEQMLNGGT